jgi:hypothetical protein
VTKRRPIAGTKVGVIVSTAPGARIVVVAHFVTGDHRKTARADGSGSRTFWYLLGNVLAGYRVYVTVRVSAHGQKTTSQMWFTPRSPPPPPPPKAAHTTAPPQHHSGAECSATASVYNAAENENNVYVNSNQPYTEATASADGYSWSRETNGSGYVEIWLNGPPPGASITVTVGGATCTTSD